MKIVRAYQSFGKNYSRPQNSQKSEFFIEIHSSEHVTMDYFNSSSDSITQSINKTEVLCIVYINCWLIVFNALFIYLFFKGKKYIAGFAIVQE